MAQSNKLKVFIRPYDGAGHINACIGLGQTLAKRGHQITILIGESFVNLTEKYADLRFVVLKGPAKPALKSSDPEDPLKEVIDLMLSTGLLSNKSPLQKMKVFTEKEKEFFDETYEKLIYFNEQIKQEMDCDIPDLFIVDHFMIEPVILQSNIPWVHLSSTNPLPVYYQTGQLPPYFSGFPTNSSKELWKEFEDVIENQFHVTALAKQNQLLRYFNCPEIVRNKKHGLFSKYLNIYGYPEELDYHEVVPIPDNFVRVDAFCRKSFMQFQIPEKLKIKIQPDDKLIYFSLGSMGSFSVPLMQSIISVLGKTTHKYIVSLGPLHEQYKLPENMWGEAFLPQTALLPLVDLVITHGGNNTVTETFSFGKPMIVMPLFGDQFDNAQRIQEKGFGVRINPFELDENKLIESIDKLLFDTELNQKLQAISQRILQSNSKEIAVIAIEKMVELHRQ